MIGPAKSSSANYAHRMRRRELLAEYPDRKLTDTEETVFCVVLCTMLGAMGAVGLVAGIQADFCPSM